MTHLRKISLLTAISILFASGNCFAGSSELIHGDESCPLKKSTAEEIGEAAGEAAANVEKVVDDLGKGAKEGYKKVN